MTELIIIKELANTPDERIDMFKDTPIINLLRERRSFAKMIVNFGTPLDDHLRMLEMYNNKIKEFFNIVEYDV
jgi:hypothetical protein